MTGENQQTITSRSSGADPGVRFGNFSLNLETGDLKRDGQPVRLRRQPAQILSLLVARAGELVSRQEVIDRVWPGTTVEYDQGLNSCVRQLRTALGDPADAPVWIETIPRQGYRFLGPVEVLDGPPGAEPATLRRMRLLFGVVAFLLLLIAASVVTGRARGGVASDARLKVAVLPLAIDSAQGGGAALVPLGDALLEDLIDNLARLEPAKLGVIARTSVLRYRSSAAPASVLGQELDVGYLVEGSLSEVAGRLRVGLRLVRTSDQTQVWATRWEGPSADLLVHSGDLAAAVVNAILPELRLPGSRAPSEPGPAVRDVFLEARYLLARQTRSSVRASVERFREVLRAEPNFSPAAAGLARGLYHLGQWTAAESAARVALRHDPENVSANLTLADIALLLDWDWAAAEGHYLRALRAAPGNAEAHNAYGFHLASAGRKTDAVSHAELAQRLDPVSPVVNGDLGYVYYWTGRYKEAVAQCRRAIVLTGSTPAAEECLIAAFGELGQKDSSLAHARRLAALLTDRESEQRALRFPTLEAYWRWAMDWHGAAREGSATPFARAMALAAQGQPEPAVTSLLAGVRVHRTLRAFAEIPGLGLYVVLGVDPRFDGLRALPEFESVMDSVGVPVAARRRSR
jgi:DNA-binding winged helix-turn-helix (wHTH) protein/TolB-like protein/Tfp pilus assembly protein PilF